VSEVYKKLQNKNYLIGVATRNRSYLITNRKGLWRYFDPKESFYPIKLFIREIELKSYEKSFPKENIELVPNNFLLPDKRQFMVDYCVSRNIEYLFMLDDDITLFYRDKNLASKYCSNYEKFMEKDSLNKLLLESILLCNEQYPIGGVALKFGSFTKSFMFEKNSFVMQYICIYIPTLQKENLDFRGLKTQFMSDRYINIALLSKGYNTLINCRYAVDDGGIGRKGGCQDFEKERIEFLHNEAAKKLQQAFPNYVSLVKKNTAINYWKKPRLDNTVHWKRFLRYKELKYIPKKEGLRILKNGGISL